MRRITILFFFVFVAGVTWLIFHLQRDNAVDDTALGGKRFYIGRSEGTIDEQEAAITPPIERWHTIKDLKKTVAIDVLCQPSSSHIEDAVALREIVGYFQNSHYVEATDYPNRQPEVKLYFRKKDGYIMAGRLFITEGILTSPEGPLIQIDRKAVTMLLDGCRGFKGSAGSEADNAAAS